jgi:hypothetical protein
LQPLRNFQSDVAGEGIAFGDGETVFTGQLSSRQESRLRNGLTFLRLRDGKELVFGSASDGRAKEGHNGQQLPLIGMTENCPNGTGTPQVSVNGQVLRVSDARSIGQVNADGRGVKEFTDALHALLGRYAGVVSKQ